VQFFINLEDLENNKNYEGFLEDLHWAQRRKENLKVQRERKDFWLGIFFFVFENHLIKDVMHLEQFFYII